MFSTRNGISIASCALLAVAFCAGCERTDSTASAAAVPLLQARQVAQPEGWDDELKLAIAADLNPDPGILEVELEAKVADLEILPGTTTPAWTYNGQLPGPLLRGNVGDRVIVHFKNSLPEPTTIHWHGVRVPNDMDGAPGATQTAIATGGEFRYEFTLQDAGTYWYHPHLDSSAQVGRGLYGAIVVNDPNDPQGLGDELVLMLSDIGLNERGELLPADNGGNFGDLFGREGTVLLVNGKVRPTLKVRSGKQQRWRVINAARARYYNLRLRDHRFVTLGGDNGFAARSADVYNVIVTPGERADVVFTPADEPGTRNVLRWVPTERGYGTVFARPREDMLLIETVSAPRVAPEPIPEVLRSIEPIDIAGAVHQRIELTIAIGHSDVVMGINGVPHARVKPIDAAIGETHVWTIVNDTDFAHPFHLHGYFFQVLDDMRVPEWKDTVSVPAKSQLQIAFELDERPGMWMYHCHILDHAEAGMMGHLHVRDLEAPAVHVTDDGDGVHRTH